MTPFEIPFTQYLLPDGKRSRQYYITESEEEYKKAYALLKYGAYFDCEILTTGDVSFTCEYKDLSEDATIFAHEICKNDETVTKAIEKLINTAYEHIR